MWYGGKNKELLGHIKSQPCHQFGKQLKVHDHSFPHPEEIDADISPPGFSKQLIVLYSLRSYYVFNIVLNLSLMKYKCTNIIEAIGLMTLFSPHKNPMM